MSKPIMSQRFRDLCLPVTIALVLLTPVCGVAKEGSGGRAGAVAKTGSAAREVPTSQTGPTAKAGFVLLCNGKNLDNWVQRGGKAEYKIEENTIIGISKLGTPNSFLCTPRDYADFVLELDFKIDDGLNSGIQIRSNVRSKKEKNAGQVYGYQVEIDPRYDRSWSGGIYDEGRRGWLNNLEGKKNEPARKAFKHNDWNHYRIEAVGDSIKTWINGIPAADLKDDMTAKGFIALQVHSIGEKKDVGKRVCWRNIMLKEIVSSTTRKKPTTKKMPLPK